MVLRNVIVFAGLDPSGGAGILIDIKTLDALEIHGLGIITALTTQNFKKITEIEAVKESMIRQQFELLKTDFVIKFAKVGMFYDENVGNCINNLITKEDLVAVVDPIITSTSGVPLITKDALKLLKDNLIPNCYLLTPNVSELKLLYNIEGSLPEVISKTKKYQEKGLIQNILIKGFRIEEKSPNIVIDILISANETIEFEKQDRGFDVHGSGCILSSAITAYLAKGESLHSSIEKAEAFSDSVLEHSISINKNYYLADPYQEIRESFWKYNILRDLNSFISYLENVKKFVSLIPEVRTNISIVIPGAVSKSQVAGIDGRITVVNGYPKAAGSIKFNASKHTADLILMAHRRFPSIRAVMNIRYSLFNLKACQEAKLEIIEIDRSKQPDNECETMKWLVKEILKEKDKFPDIIYDKGEIGKEPMIRLFGKDSKDLQNKVQRILDHLNLT